MSSQLFTVMAGGGNSNAILRATNDGSDVATQFQRLFQNHPEFNHLQDIAFDLDDGYFFVADSDGVTTRILRGNIADLAAGTGTPALTVVYSGSADQFINGIEIDTVNNRLYFTEGDILSGHSLKRIDYDGANLVDYGPVALASDPIFGFVGGVYDFVIDAAHDTAYLTYTLVDAFFSDPPTAPINYIVKVNSLADPGSGYSIVAISNGDDPDGEGGNPDNHFPDSEGSLRGIDIDADAQVLYFVTGRLGPDGTAGIFKLDLATGTVTEIWEQPANSAYDSYQPFPTTLLEDIEVDTIGGVYYVTTFADSDVAEEHDGTATDEAGSRIFIGNLADVGVAPSEFVNAFEPTSNGAPFGMEINYAPTVTAPGAGIAYVEQGPAADVLALPTVSDPDQTTIKSATVAIAAGFTAGDTLTFVAVPGIAGSYNAMTGVLTLTGSASFADYQAVLDSIAFSAAGDNPDDYGANPTRTISVTLFDGLMHSDPATTVIDVTAVNDAPVNTVGGPLNLVEGDTVAVVGLSVSDVDADPASHAIQVTLSATLGTISVSTSEPGGIGAGQVSGNGTDTVVITATQNQINATFAAANGVTYTAGSSGGIDALTMTTNDLGHGGAGGAQQDVDAIVVTVIALNDAPTVAGDGTEELAAIQEDMPSAAGDTVASIFAGQFADADSGDDGSFAGVAVVDNPSSGATGQWQYHDGSTWVDIGAATTAAAVLLAADTAIRFNPALDYNGPAPTLTVHLVDGSDGPIVSGTTANATIRGGMTRYSQDAVTLDQTVTPVNDAPTGVVANLSAAEDSDNGTAAGTIVAQDPDSSSFTYTLLDSAGGRFAMDSGGNVTVADGLLLDYEQAASHVIRVRVTDDQGASSDFDVTVSVTDVLGEHVVGDARANTFVGGAEADTFLGGLGNDTLIGGGGDDTLHGEAGDDILIGGEGADILHGGDGNDILDGGAGADTLIGGAGNDVFVFRKGEANGDTIFGYFGVGAAEGDSIQLVGYGAGTTFTRVGGGNSTLWEINDNGFVEYVNIHATGQVHPTDVTFFG